MSYHSYADLGGTSGHGRVIPEPEGELFHAAFDRGRHEEIVVRVQHDELRIDPTQRGGELVGLTLHLYANVKLRVLHVGHGESSR